MNQREMAEFMDEFYDNAITPNREFIDKDTADDFDYENDDAHFDSFEVIMAYVVSGDYRLAQEEVRDEIIRLLFLAEEKLGVHPDEFFGDKLHSLRESGQEEYARKDQNAFANFERVADIQNIMREQVLMTYLLKHIDGIASWINGNRDQREGLSDRIGDACVYLFLLGGMLEERADGNY